MYLIVQLMFKCCQMERTLDMDAQNSYIDKGIRVQPKENKSHESEDIVFHTITDQVIVYVYELKWFYKSAGKTTMSRDWLFQAQNNQALTLQTVLILSDRFVPEVFKNGFTWACICVTFSYNTRLNANGWCNSNEVIKI